jgi:hypothetical protein
MALILEKCRVNQSDSWRLQILPKIPSHIKVCLCLELLRPKMDLPQKSVSRVAWSSSGAKNGSATGKTLSIALRNVNRSDQANPLHSL